MNRIRVIGLAIVAVVALSALTAASASAFTEFVAKPASQKVTAGQTKAHKFTIGSASVECKKAEFTGETSLEKFTAIEFNASYGECTAFGFVGSNVKMNECKYNLHISGAVDVKCTGTKKIEIEVNNGGPCIISVGSQNGLKNGTYTNVIGKNGRASVEDKFNIKKIVYSSNGKGLGCPGNGQEAVYEGASVAEGSGTLEVK